MFLQGNKKTRTQLPLGLRMEHGLATSFLQPDVYTLTPGFFLIFLRPVCSFVPQEQDGKKHIVNPIVQSIPSALG